MYVFPGIGLGTILSKATTVTQSMIYASAEALSTALNAEERAAGWLYPEIQRIREVSVVVAAGVIRAAQQAGVDREITLRDMGDDKLSAYISQKMYDPHAEIQGIDGEVQAMISDVPATNGINGHTQRNGVNGYAQTNGYH